MHVDLVLAIYEDTWEEEESKAWQKEPDPAAWQRSGVKKVETDIRDRRIRGRDQVIGYMEATQNERLTAWTLPDTGWVASEVPFEVDLGGVRVRGFIDLIMVDPQTGALLVRDIKTGAKKPVGTVQLATYAIALRKQYGVHVAWGDYWMCKDDCASSPEYLGDIPEARIASQYQMVDASIRDERWPANVGDHCARCDVARHCPFVGGETPAGADFLGT